MKKIISLILLLSITASIFAGCSENQKGKKYDMNAKINTISTSLIVSEENLELSWNNEGKFIVLTDKKSGKIWSGVPYKYFESGGSSDNVNSPINITVVNAAKAQWDTINGCVESVKKNRVSAEKIDKGLKITYYFDNYKISVPVKYELKNGGLNVSVDSSEIVEDGDNVLLSVAVAPFLCAAENITKDSYLFVPSGSGSLMYVDERAEGTRKYTAEVYGEDDSRLLPEEVTNKTKIYLPVYGVKEDKNALFAVIGEGAEYAEIYAEAGNRRTGYSTVYSTFYLRGYDVVETDQWLWGYRDLNRISDTMLNTKFAVTYYPLSGDDADYNGMAKKYKELLFGDSKSNTQKDNPIYSLDIYQIFDAGITHQQGNLLGTTCEFKNIVYQNNVIEKCAWSVEYYMNTPNAGFVHKMSNITINDNIMRLAGYGFGQYRDDEWHYPCHIMSWWLESEGNTNNADAGTFSITGNIFDRSRTSLIEIHAEAEKSLPVLSGNTYIQSVNGAYGRYSTYEMNYHTNQNYCNHNLNIKLGSIANETDAKLYFTDYTDVISDKALAQIDYFRENPVSENHTFAVTLANKKTVRNLKVLENGVRITETEIDSLKNDANSESVKIAFFADTHFVGTLTENDEQKQHLVDLYELRKNTFRNTVNSTPISLAFGDLFDRTVIGGDLFDFYSEGNMNLYKSVVSDNYPDVLTLLGNHEAAEGFSGISPETPTPLADIYADLNERIFGYGSIKTQGSFETLEQAEQFNDIYLAHNLVKDSKGNEKVLLLMMDDQNYTYQFDEFHFDRLEFYFQYAKENKIPILIFQHVPLCTGNATEIISPYDVIKNGNGVGSNWGLSGSPALPGHSYHDTHHPMTNRVYDLITNNADVVKGVFTGHEHNNIYTEIVAKNSDGTSAIIPQYTIAGNYFYSNINLITVK